ncbi:MAG: DUF2953 domain-containing protein [Oscillospiraceae bacterium]|nr:DUF2953 domain-containing protein [Oscillospiraceae bacterium]
MKVLLIIAAVLFLIGCIPVGVLFRYHDEIQLKLTVLFFKIGILPKKPLPRKKREKAEAKKAAKAAKKAAAKAEKKKKQQAQSLIAKPKPAEPPKPKKSLPDKLAGLIPWAKLAAGFVGEFFHRKLCVRRMWIRAALAGGDPAKLARTTGTAWETIGIAVPILERAFRVKDRRIAVYPDFQASKTDVEAELWIRLRIGGLVLLAFKYGFRALKILISQKKQAKAARKAQAQLEENQTETEEKAVS